MIKESYYYYVEPAQFRAGGRSPDDRRDVTASLQQVAEVRTL